MTSTANIVPFQQPQAPAVPFGDMVRLAEAVARSGLFGIKTPDQALALMALAQAEGRHPATVARDYHIINGSPSKKAEAMQRDFLMAGGKIEWHELSDDAVDATFSHPVGGTARIRWDTARCKQAGLIGGNHQKFPRQMKRSRVVSEGVRTIWPLATSGMYVPEEVVEFAPQQAASTDTRADLDTFAATKPIEIVDHDTGEVLDVAAIVAQARAFAEQGTDTLRTHLRALTREARAALNGKVGTKEQPGELLRLAIEADERAAQDSPAGNTGNPAPQPRTERQEPAGDTMPDLLGGPDRPPAGPDAYRIDLPDPANSDDVDTFEAAILALIATDAPRNVIRENNAYNLARFERLHPMRHNKLMRALERP